jgi:hypothetical protein
VLHVDWGYAGILAQLCAGGAGPTDGQVAFGTGRIAQSGAITTCVVKPSKPEQMLARSNSWF